MGRLIKHNGSPAICHNGKIYPPMMATICNVDNGKYIIDKEYLKKCYTEGAEKALAYSQRIVSKAYRKVGFVDKK